MCSVGFGVLRVFIHFRFDCTRKARIPQRYRWGVIVTVGSDSNGGENINNAVGDVANGRRHSRPR